MPMHGLSPDFPLFAKHCSKRCIIDITFFVAKVLEWNFDIFKENWSIPELDRFYIGLDICHLELIQPYKCQIFLHKRWATNMGVLDMESGISRDWGPNKQIRCEIANIISWCLFFQYHLMMLFFLKTKNTKKNHCLQSN
jgi:hypothetical protein